MATLVNIDSIVAIDPMAQLLPERVYLIWLEMRHPHTPLVDTIAAVAKEMTPVERHVVFARARAMAELAKAVQECVA